MRESIARSGLVAIAALALSSCTTAPDPLLVPAAKAEISGNWRIERQLDRITGAPISSALLPTRTSAHSGSFDLMPATLQLVCFKNEPVIRFAFDFNIGSNKNSELGYRFDDKPGHAANARFLLGYRTVVIDDKVEVAQFLSELAASNLLYVRIRSLNAGRSSAEFKVEGAQAAIDKALADCSVAGPQRKQAGL